MARSLVYRSPGACASACPHRR